MAKTLGQKSIIIRTALEANPGIGNTALAELLNRSSECREAGIEVTGQDVAAQKQAMKKLAEGPRWVLDAVPEGRGFEAARPPAAVPIAETKASNASPIDLLDKVFLLAKECGGFAELKRLVDRCAELESL